MSESAIIAWQALVIGALGAAVGSFLNVVLVRTAGHRPYLVGRSACPHCGRTLRWYELVPVGSFLMLGGRCRTCRKRLSVQYLLMECLTAALFMLVFLRFGFSLMTPLGMVVVSAMLLIAMYDLRWSLIPDEFSYLLIAAGLLAASVGGVSWVDLMVGVLAGGAFFGGQYLLSRGRWIGSGDIFLGIALGALLGWRALALALGLAYFLGALVAIVQIMRHRTKVGRAMAFGPYLMIGGLLAWLYGEVLINWYLLDVIQF